MGVIYSTGGPVPSVGGQFGNANCTYVQNDKKTDFNFSVPAPDQCGTKFVEMKGKPAFLENVLIIQNEPGIQEVWDSARGIRCVFDGKGGDVTQKVTAALAVSKIDQQVVSFSADTQATATLDIQVGRGPFAPSAAGLVKIGELMTLVVTVEGPEKASLLVRQCTASDGQKKNTIMLTDNNGCVVKKKLMGSWQITKNTGDKKKPVIAFAHFQAFKFPDQMEVMIECQVDLCSGDCGVCPDDMKKTMDKMAGRRRRRRSFSINYGNNRSEEHGEQFQEHGEEFRRFEIPDDDMTEPSSVMILPNDLSNNHNLSDGQTHNYYPLETVLSVTSSQTDDQKDRTRQTRDRETAKLEGNYEKIIYLENNRRKQDQYDRANNKDNLQNTQDNPVTHGNAYPSENNLLKMTVNNPGDTQGTVIYVGTVGGVMEGTSLHYLDNHYPTTHNFSQLDQNLANRMDLNRDIANRMEVNRDTANRVDVNRDTANRMNVNRDTANRMDVNRDTANRMNVNRDTANRMDVNKETANRMNVNRDTANRMDVNRDTANRMDVNKVTANRVAVNGAPANRVDGVLRVANRLQVLAPEDIDRRQQHWDVHSVQRHTPAAGDTPPPLVSGPALAVAVGLLAAMAAVVVLLCAWLRARRTRKQLALPDDQSFHAFSSVAYR
ncbi:Zona pellucida domain [Trinorchestia longiramus]|nr:Zona pellucida domain [Trinorchestia longiramus]